MRRKRPTEILSALKIGFAAVGRQLPIGVGEEFCAADSLALIYFA
jgi:hypothetical protein